MNMSYDDSINETHTYETSELFRSAGHSGVAQRAQHSNNAITVDAFSVLLDAKLSTTKHEILEKLEDNKSDIMRQVRQQAELSTAIDCLTTKIRELEQNLNTQELKIKTLEKEKTEFTISVR
ncbi:hypothetical protein O0L34_g17856 [Tuta absoluta]|nr:hypothetical protein O0L34_g17856 [Tuta absoluta]